MSVADGQVNRISGDTTRPPHIPRERWYHPATPWTARRRAVDEWNRANRPTDTTRESNNIDNTIRRVLLTTKTADLIPEVTDLLAQGLDALTIAQDLGTTVDALEQRFRKANRKDLAQPFSRARNKARAKPCTECGQPAYATRCRGCVGRDGNGRYTTTQKETA